MKLSREELEQKIEELEKRIKALEDKQTIINVYPQSLQTQPTYNPPQYCTCHQSVTSLCPVHGYRFNNSDYKIKYEIE